MKNLFVLHTQYTLALASGMIKNRFKNDQNDLILFKDFALSEELKAKLDTVFLKTIYFEGAYPSINKTLTKRIQNYYYSINKSKQFIDTTYNRVFIVLDMNLPEMRIMKIAYKFNPEVNFIALEDGSYPYFLNYIASGGLDSNILLRKFRKFLFKYFLGCGEFYSFEGRFMGANTWLKEFYLTYKDYAREIYKNKKKIEITSNEFFDGISELYASPKLMLDDNSIVLILDKLDVYKDIHKIGSLIKQIVHKYTTNHRTIYYKYHPREESNLNELSACLELNRNIGIESYYQLFRKSNATLIGIKSTGLQTALKSGIKTITVAKMVDEDNPDIDKFYKSIGINSITTLDELNNIL